MALFKEFINNARGLTAQGKLMEATRAIQQGLGFGLSSRKPPPTTTTAAPPASASARLAVETPYAQPHPVHLANGPDVADVTDVAFRESPRQAPEIPVKDPLDDAPKAAPTTPSSFSAGSFDFAHNQYAYRLFIPTRVDASPLPLVVLLHGCKQDSEDFAKGTAMNTLAERGKFMVLYPEQLRKSNTMGCWNWFDPVHQTRDQGEPAMIAELASLMVERHNADPSKVYVAGLSAGAAMAALVGQLYPERFAAVGMHSGLAPGAARNVASAFSAMSRGPAPTAKTAAIGVPVILFQGTNDTTVAPGNADAIVQKELAFWASAGTKLTKTVSSENAAGTARTATQSTWKDSAGKPWVTLWSVDMGPHAWSGGDASGSFTDPKGPSASEVMLRFFKLHSQAR